MTEDCDGSWEVVARERRLPTPLCFSVRQNNACDRVFRVTNARASIIHESNERRRRRFHTQCPYPSSCTSRESSVLSISSTRSSVAAVFLAGV